MRPWISRTRILSASPLFWYVSNTIDYYTIPEMDLRNPLCTEKSMLFILSLKQGRDSTISSKQWYQCPNKRTNVLQIFFKKT